MAGGTRARALGSEGVCGSEGRHVGRGNREWQIMLLDHMGLVNKAKGLGRPRKV